MRIQADGFAIRPWRKGDEESLIRHANSRKVWRNLTDRFPHPYRYADAVAWIELNETRGSPPHNFAIELPDGEAIGGAGLERYTDLRTRTAEIGYWLGEAHWGKGIATEATRRLTDYAFATFDFERIEAGVIDWNPASARVLEKAGYTLESRQARSIFKDGEIADLLIYVKLRT